MKKTVIRPFDIGSVALLLIGIAFPCTLVYCIISVIAKGYSTFSILGIALSAILTYFVSASALRIVFMSKFTFYDTYFEAVYFEPFAEHFGSEIFKIVSPQKVSIKYADIEKFGSFEGHQMRKNGRDEKNNLNVVVSVGGVPAYFVLPSYFDNTRNYFVINDTNDNGFIIDGKLYSVTQVKRVLQKIEKYSHKQTTGGYPDVPNMLGLLMILGLASVVVIPYGLIGLECKLNPTHTRAIDSPSRTIYFVSCMFFMISIIVNLLFSKKPTIDDDVSSQRKFKIVMSLISAALLIVVISAFIISVIN